MNRWRGMRVVMRVPQFCHSQWQKLLVGSAMRKARMRRRLRTEELRVLRDDEFAHTAQTTARARLATDARS